VDGVDGAAGGGVVGGNVDDVVTVEYGVDSVIGNTVVGPLAAPSPHPPNNGTAQITTTLASRDARTVSSRPSSAT
jgi:hypothetical protein